MAEITYSGHARQRMREMSVPEGEVESTIENAEAVIEAVKHGTTNYQGRRIAVAIDTRSDGVLHVVTVLWRYPEVYPSRLKKEEP